MSKEFPKAVTQLVTVRHEFRPGLQSLLREDRRRLIVDHTSKLTGSVNLDAALAQSNPNDSRWDYGVGYSHSLRSSDVAHWIEVHPCTDREVAVIEAKLRWLKSWLHASAGELSRLPQRFAWVSSGSTALSPSSPARRRLAEQGLVVAGSRYRIS